MSMNVLNIFKYFCPDRERSNLKDEQSPKLQTKNVKFVPGKGAGAGNNFLTIELVVLWEITVLKSSVLLDRSDKPWAIFWHMAATLSWPVGDISGIGLTAKNIDYIVEIVLFQFLMSN